MKGKLNKKSLTFSYSNFLSNLINLFLFLFNLKNKIYIIAF